VTIAGVRKISSWPAFKALASCGGKRVLATSSGVSAIKDPKDSVDVPSRGHHEYADECVTADSSDGIAAETAAQPSGRVMLKRFCGP